MSFHYQNESQLILLRSTSRRAALKEQIEKPGVIAENCTKFQIRFMQLITFGCEDAAVDIEMRTLR